MDLEVIMTMMRLMTIVKMMIGKHLMNMEHERFLFAVKTNVLFVKMWYYSTHNISNDDDDTDDDWYTSSNITSRIYSQYIYLYTIVSNSLIIIYLKLWNHSTVNQYSSKRISINGLSNIIILFYVSE